MTDQIDAAPAPLHPVTLYFNNAASRSRPDASRATCASARCSENRLAAMIIAPPTHSLTPIASPAKQPPR